jgi:hypothetical protein
MSFKDSIIHPLINHIPTHHHSNPSLLFFCFFFGFGVIDIGSDAFGDLEFFYVDGKDDLIR